MFDVLLRRRYRFIQLGRHLAWSLPLVGVGALKITYPPLVAIAVFLALIPWGARWTIFHKPTRRTALDGALILFVVSAFLGIAVSYNKVASLPMLLTLLGSISLFYAISNTVDQKVSEEGLVIVAVLLALLYIGQVSSAIPAILLVPHPNAVASVLASVLLLAVVLAWQAQHRSGRWLWRLSLLIIVGALITTGSRGAWIGLAVAVILWIILWSPKQALRLSTLGGGLVLGIGFSIYTVPWLRPLEQSALIMGSFSETTNTRMALYQNSLALLRDYPLTGVGLGDAFTLVYSRYSLLIGPEYLFYAHNLFLSVALGFGVLGLGALIWLISSFYRFVSRVEKSDTDIRPIFRFRAAWLGTTAVFVHGLTDSPQFSNYHWTMPMLFVLLGLVIARSELYSRPAGGQALIGSPKRLYRRLSWRGWLPASLMLMVALVYFQKPLAVVWHTNLGSVYQTNADLADLEPAAREAARAQAIMHFEQALALNPALPSINRRLGMIALDVGELEAAIGYLERAYQLDPQNQTTLKALGLSYQWTKRPDAAAQLLDQLNDHSGIKTEPNIWHY